MTYSLGRIPSKFDPRDYSLKDYMPKGLFKLSMVTEKAWEFPSLPLDQDDTNHCCGYSMANFCINIPVHADYTNDDGHKFYYICKEIDGEPKDEEGSTIRSVAKALKQVDRIGTYAFAPDLASIKWWLLNRSPVIIGTIWTTGMFEPDENNIIYPSGDVVGGHAYLINEWRKDNYIGIQNSWGTRWGKNGKAYISASNFEKIFRSGGEALTAVELPAKEKNTVAFCDIFKRIL
jgi:hypothetical protein